MPALSVTRLRVRSAVYLPVFLWHTFMSQRQLRRSGGFIAGSVARAKGLTFWTVTAWQDEAAVKGFRDSGAHRLAMPKLLDICDEASLAHWTQEGVELPASGVMLERLQAIGRISKVRHPSEGQRAGRTAPDGQAPGRGTVIKPAISR